MRKISIFAATIIIIGLITIAALYYKLPPISEPLQSGLVADRILVDKSDHTLTIFKNDKILKTYPISLGRGGFEPKQKEGDKKTPDGEYVIDRRNEQSSFYRSLHISYPDAQDIEQAAQNNISAGSDIMIHGLRNGSGFLGRFHLMADWTQGCIAVTNKEIDELWRAAPDGTPIEIKQ